MFVPAPVCLATGKHRLPRILRRLMLAIAVLLCPRQPARATDGIEPIGLSTQSMARGGTDVAVGDSALSQIENPATLTLSPSGKWRLDAAGELLMPQLHWTGPRDSADSAVRHIPLGHAGLVFPGGGPWRFGLALYSKSQLGAEYTMHPAMFPYSDRRMEASLRDFGLAADAAYRLTDKLSLGIGVRGELLTGEFTSVNGPVTLDFSRGYAFGGGFQFGVHYRFLPTLSAGLGYRSPTWFQDLTGEHETSSLAGDWQTSLFPLPPVYVGRASVETIRLPQKLSAGLCWDAADRLRLAAEGRWINYSNSVLDIADFRVAGPLNLHVPSPLGYHDQWVLAAGAEFKLTKHWLLGCGYHYASNPVSRLALLPVVSLVTEHHLTAGLRYQRENWWVGAGYVLGFPASFASHGRTRVPLGVDYAHSQVDQTQHSITCGFGLVW